MGPLQLQLMYTLMKTEGNICPDSVYFDSTLLKPTTLPHPSLCRDMYR